MIFDFFLNKSPTQKNQKFTVIHDDKEGR